MNKYVSKKQTVVLTDKSLMPNGKYKGKTMEDVPAIYLMYIYDNGLSKPEVRTYIESNIDVILKQAKENGYASKED